MIPECYSAS